MAGARDPGACHLPERKPSGFPAIYEGSDHRRSGTGKGKKVPRVSRPFRCEKKKESKLLESMLFGPRKEEGGGRKGRGGGTLFLYSISRPGSRKEKKNEKALSTRVGGHQQDKGKRERKKKGKKREGRKRIMTR